MTVTADHAAAPAPTGRLRAAFKRAHTPVAGVRRWARIAAYAIPFTVLPSGVWRIMTVIFHIGDEATHGVGQLPSWLPGRCTSSPCRSSPS